MNSSQTQHLAASWTKLTESRDCDHQSHQEPPILVVENHPTLFDGESNPRSMQVTTFLLWQTHHCYSKFTKLWTMATYSQILLCYFLWEPPAGARAMRNIQGLWSSECVLRKPPNKHMTKGQEGRIPPSSTSRCASESICCGLQCWNKMGPFASLYPAAAQGKHP